MTTKLNQLTKITLLASVFAALLLAFAPKSADACGYSPDWSALTAAADHFDADTWDDPKLDRPVVKIRKLKYDKKDGLAVIELETKDGVELHLVSFDAKDYFNWKVTDTTEIPKPLASMLIAADKPPKS